MDKLGLDFGEEVKKDEDVSGKIALPSTNRASGVRYSSELDKMSIDDISPEDEKAMSITLNGNDLTNYAGALEGNTTKEWLEDNGGLSLNINNPVANDINLEASFTSYLGLGSLYQFPLYHSGMWISLTAIGNDELLNLEASLADEAVELGRRTNSLIFSNHNVVKNRILTEFIIRHIHTCTVKVDNKFELLDLIDTRDLYPLVRGLQASIYTTGIESTIACSEANKLEGGKPVCNKSFHATLDPSKMLRTRFTHLTDDQKAFMASRTPNSVTVEEVNNYKFGSIVDSVKTEGVLKESVVTVPTTNGGTLELTLGSPSLRDHIDAGTLWIEGITTTLHEIMQSKDSIEVNARVDMAARASLIRTYIHFIKEVRIPGTDIEATTKSKVRLALNSVMSDKILFDGIMKAIKKHINDTTFSIVGINKFTCTSCNREQDTKDSPIKEIIPINAVKSFLILLALRTQELMENSDTY